jgi:hypothetical protein
MRSTLRQLQVDTSRVLDIHYPDYNVLALLVHNDYAEQARSTLIASKCKILQDFDPLSPDILHDPKFSSLDTEARQSKVLELRQQRLVRIIQRIQHSTKQIAIARDFQRKGWISDSQFENLLQILRPTKNSPSNPLSPTQQNHMDIDEIAAQFQDNTSTTASETTPIENNTQAGGEYTAPSAL